MHNPALSRITCGMLLLIIAACIILALSLAIPMAWPGDIVGGA
jgi:hypothetical protein